MRHRPDYGDATPIQTMTDKPKPRTVEIVHPSYQPRKAELEADLRVKSTFKEAVDALTQPVRISYMDKPRRESDA